MARVLITLLLAAGCARPAHEPAPVPPRADVALSRPVPAGTPAVKVAVFDPSGRGNWLGTPELSPAPASLVTPCLAPGAVGWVSVNVATHGSEASTTSVAEASWDVSAETRSCIANALRGVHTKLDAMQMLVYVTFSPE